MTEPTFTLRAQDKFAPKIIEAWAFEVERACEGVVSSTVNASKAKAKAARALAHDMRAWQERNYCKVPD